MSATAGDCPGCSLPDQPTDDCERCEFHNLVIGRHHYCGDPTCYCRNLPGLGYMRRSVRDRFVAEHRARVEDHEAGHPNGRRGICNIPHVASEVEYEIHPDLALIDDFDGPDEFDKAKGETQ